MNKYVTTNTFISCPCCGSGCSVKATVDVKSDRLGKFLGDITHPANLGRLCIKGCKLAETSSHEDRLLYPYINGKRTLWDKAFQKTAQACKSVIATLLDAPRAREVAE